MNSLLIPSITSVLVAAVTALGAIRLSTHVSRETSEAEEKRLSFDAVVAGLDERIDEMQAEVQACHIERDSLKGEVRAVKAENRKLREDVSYLTRRVKDLEAMR